MKIFSWFENLLSMIVGPITSVFSCLSSKFLKSLAWRPKFKLHFSIWWVPDPPQKKSILLVSTDHHIPKVKKLYQQCIQDSLSGASAWVSRNNSKSHIEKVCPFLIFSWLFWWSPKREPQFGAGISWTPDAPRALCGAGSLAGNSLQIHHHASALFSLHALCGCLPFTAGEAELPLTAVL